MRGQTDVPYERLLVEWQAKREVVDAYHRTLHFLAQDIGDAPQRQRARWREVNDKLADSLIALRHITEQLGRYERERAVAS